LNRQKAMNGYAATREARRIGISPMIDYRMAQLGR
jgi:hypothetical protein